MFPAPETPAPRVDAHTDARADVRADGHTTDRSPMRWLMRAERISKTFGETPALIDASLTIAPGEAVAIMGPSGSGKSTLLHVLAGILRPDAGEVLLRRPGGGVGGVDDAGVDDLTELGDDDRSAFRLRRFGFVFQQGLLLPELTAAENISLPLLLAGYGRGEAAARAEAELSRLGLAGLGVRRIGQLSGGQAQRVAIARALAPDPSLIFADEPTGALDSRAADGVLDALLAAGRDGQRALVVVTHDEHVASRCDRTVRLRDGRIESRA
ncbi:ABC transporter ATP-binding protein [Leucobacter sp. NPDC058333]|uniref:ABC transporter ATP-binding protein n=1 Tax=Leucobacter sp. NPDC058333 TaxID=3346450 RepID=UPI00365AEC27